MTPYRAYKDDIFRELEELLAQAEPEQIAQLLSDIARGEFPQTAETRAGSNDDLCNVTNIKHVGEPAESHQRDAQQLPNSSRQVRRAGYVS